MLRHERLHGQAAAEALGHLFDRRLGLDASMARERPFKVAAMYPRNKFPTDERAARWARALGLSHCQGNQIVSYLDGRIDDRVFARANAVSPSDADVLSWLASGHGSDAPRGPPVVLGVPVDRCVLCGEGLEPTPDAPALGVADLVKDDAKACRYYDASGDYRAGVFFRFCSDCGALHKLDHAKRSAYVEHRVVLGPTDDPGSEEAVLAEVEQGTWALRFHLDGTNVKSPPLSPTATADEVARAVTEMTWSGTRGIAAADVQVTLAEETPTMRAYLVRLYLRGDHRRLTRLWTLDRISVAVIKRLADQNVAGTVKRVDVPKTATPYSFETAVAVVQSSTVTFVDIALVNNGASRAPRTHRRPPPRTDPAPSHFPPFRRKRLIFRLRQAPGLEVQGRGGPGVAHDGE